MKYTNQIQFLKQLRMMPKHGADLDKANRDLRDTEISATKLSDSLNKVQKAYSEIIDQVQDGESITSKAIDMIVDGTNRWQSGILGVIGVQQQLQGISDKLIKQATKLEQQFSGLQKTFGANVKMSGMLAEQFILIGAAVDTDHKKMSKYAAIMDKFLPLQAKFYDAGKKGTRTMFGVADILQKNLQVTDKATEGYVRYTAGLDDGADSLTAAMLVAKEMGGEDGASIYMKQIAEDIGQAGAAARIQYGRVAGSLEVAVLKARQLGISMTDLTTTGEQFLDIESSVGKELEYQLLSGNRLVDQKTGESLSALYREATIRGSMNDQADIMQTIMEQEGDTLRTNLFARKQMADLLGTSEEKLSAMLEKEKLIEKFGLSDKALDLNVDQFTDAIETSEKFADMTAEEQKEFFKSFEAGKIDSRTTAEVANQHLKNIESATLKTASKKLGFDNLGDLFADTSEEILELGGFARDMQTIVGQTQHVGKSIIETTGLLNNVSTIFNEIAPAMKQFAKYIPMIGKYGDAVISMGQDAATKVEMVTSGDVTVLEAPKEGKASGGPVLAGRSYTVGEAGAEMFTPSSNGTITSNNNMGIDYNRLASAMANIRIIVGPDIYGASSMNIASV